MGARARRSRSIKAYKQRQIDRSGGRVTGLETIVRAGVTKVEEREGLGELAPTWHCFDDENDAATSVWWTAPVFLPRSWAPPISTVGMSASDRGGRRLSVCLCPLSLGISFCSPPPQVFNGFPGKSSLLRWLVGREVPPFTSLLICSQVHSCSCYFSTRLDWF